MSYIHHCEFFLLHGHVISAVRSGGPKLRQTEEYPKGFGKVLAVRHVFGKDSCGLGGITVDWCLIDSE